MHSKILDAVLEQCRKRIAEGDCPITSPVCLETLEEAVVELADALEAATHANRPRVQIKTLKESLTATTEALLPLDDTQAAREAFEAWAKSAEWQIDFTPAPKPRDNERGEVYDSIETDDYFTVWLAASRSIPGAAALLREAGWTVEEPFSKPGRNDGGMPCGECHLQSGDTCDICGAVAP